MKSKQEATQAQVLLEEAYRATSYEVRMPWGWETLRIDEVASPRLDQWLRTFSISDWSFLTAWNPKSRASPESWNRTAQLYLQEELEARGLPWYFGLGRPTSGNWQPEESLWVPGLDPQTGVRLAQDFGQNALVQGQPGQPIRLRWCCLKVGE